MAKKKSKPIATLKNVVVLRGTEEWKAWLDELCEARGAPITVTIDQALRLLADHEKRPKPPKRI